MSERVGMEGVREGGEIVLMAMCADVSFECSDFFFQSNHLLLHPLFAVTQLLLHLR